MTTITCQLNKRKTQTLVVSNNHPHLEFSGDSCRVLVENVFKGEDFKNDCEIGIVFVDDAYILELNSRYFKKSHPTDVISFNLSESEEILEGEIYINLDRAQSQATEYNVDLENETSRLVVHGVLHLLGYKDYTEQARQQMHEIENRYLKV